jgi:ABC-type polar amino acid transport system ATPase subunit
MQNRRAHQALYIASNDIRYTMELTVEHLAHIRSGTVNFGDLTLIVGPQATGKSIFLQTLKLVLDGASAGSFLVNKGYNITYKVDEPKSFNKLQELVFGEGIIPFKIDATNLMLEKRPINVWANLQAVDEDEHGNLFPAFPKRALSLGVPWLIPANRSLSFASGLPQQYEDFDSEDPLSLKYFSNDLWSWVNKSKKKLKNSDVLEDLRCLKPTVRQNLLKAIYPNVTLQLGEKSRRSRFELAISDNNIPYLSWSAGQREFTPMLLDLLRIFSDLNDEPEAYAKNNWLLIEEPELGLHPLAIEAVCLLLLNLTALGFRVVVATHASLFLEAVWALQRLHEHNASGQDFARLFGVQDDDGQREMSELYAKLSPKEYRTYYFQRQDDGAVEIQDISTLELGDSGNVMHEWGGLSSFSSRANDIIADVVQRSLSTHG